MSKTNIINLNKEIDKAPDSWFADLPNIDRLFLRSRYRYRNHLVANMSSETRRLLESKSFYKEHFHKIYPSLHNDSKDRGIDGWVIQDPRSGLYYVYFVANQRYSELSTIENLDNIFVPLRFLPNRYGENVNVETQTTESLYARKFHILVRDALKAKCRIVKKNNPDLVKGLLDVVATKAQIKILTKFNNLDNQITLFKSRLTDNENCDLYKQDLDDLFSAFAVFKNSLDKTEIAQLKSRPKEKKSKKK